MKVKDLVEKYDFNQITDLDLDRELSGAYSCDLLSWVMANGKENEAWITVQSHMNVIAVASLVGFSCVILPEDVEPEDKLLKQATAKDIVILQTSLRSFEIFKCFYKEGL